ncbi:hypothetical protein OS493_030191 [Desmophyllum pertusum]|uniref:Uncharacterized protein n=1 Tax=Desmophyllum pertusum TaxID=174260 RepID=A0A9W9YWJ8_9CNID|nr:hypothetical protein OS493_030191 [Desmophyllum pertusum]
MELISQRWKIIHLEYGELFTYYRLLIIRRVTSTSLGGDITADNYSNAERISLCCVSDVVVAENATLNNRTRSEIAL